MNYVFDIEGSLLDNGTLDDTFAAWLLTWSSSRDVCLITDNEYSITSDILGEQLVMTATQVYDVAHNAAWVKGQIVDKVAFEMSDAMQRILERIVSVSPFAGRGDDHTVIHPSWCTFSVVGNSATPELREQYSEYDGNVAERRRIIGQLRNCFPHYKAKLNGDIAIDIFPESNDQDQHFSALKPFVYFGSRVYMGDPKYNVAKFADVHHVTSDWQHTFKILQTTYNEETK